MSTGNNHTDSFEELLPFVAGFAVALPTFPGFLLCVPGLVFVGLAMIPVVIPALVLSVAAAVLAVPWLIGRTTWRAVSARRARARASAPETEPRRRLPVRVRVHHSRPSVRL